jgi:hypothetical protein
MRKLPESGLFIPYSGDLMKPKKQELSNCEDLFRRHPEQMLDQRHVLYRFSDKIDWKPAEAYTLKRLTNH